MSNTCKILLLFLTINGLGACGQVGSLHLPHDQCVEINQNNALGVKG